MEVLKKVKYGDGGGGGDVEDKDKDKDKDGATCSDLADKYRSKEVYLFLFNPQLMNIAKPKFKSL